MAGYLFYCPDTGVEWSLNHPVRSGEIPDAQNIRKATAEAALEELKEAWTTIRDRDRLIDHYRGILGPIAGAVPEWGPTLQAALDRIDAADKECPVRQSKRSVEKCPKCSATVSDGCGLNVRALHSLEADIRSLLVPPPPETGG